MKIYTKLAIPIFLLQYDFSAHLKNNQPISFSDIPKIFEEVIRLCKLLSCNRKSTFKTEINRAEEKIRKLNLALLKYSHSCKSAKSNKQPNDAVREHKDMVIFYRDLFLHIAHIRQISHSFTYRKAENDSFSFDQINTWLSVFSLILNIDIPLIFDNTTIYLSEKKNGEYDKKSNYNITRSCDSPKRPERNCYSTMSCDSQKTFDSIATTSSSGIRHPQSFRNFFSPGLVNNYRYSPYTLPVNN